jgi:hypothetical protein
VYERGEEEGGGDVLLLWLRVSCRSLCLWTQESSKRGGVKTPARLASRYGGPNSVTAQPLSLTHRRGSWKLWWTGVQYHSINSQLPGHWQP